MDLELIRQRNQAQINKDNIRKNRHIVDYYFRGATASAGGGTRAQGNQRAHENHKNTLKELVYITLTVMLKNK